MGSPMAVAKFSYRHCFIPILLNSFQNNKIITRFYQKYLSNSIEIPSIQSN